MPALLPKDDDFRTKILLTGATGYIGQWVLRSLLDKDYGVKVAVRSEGKAQAVKDVFSEPTYRDKMDFIVIEDMTKKGAFDEAVVGIEGVMHVASTVPSLTETPEETVRIAKEATITILESALKRGANIKRIVITSSIAAVWTKQDEPRTFSEDDWNEYTLPRYEAGQRDPVTAYFASKLLSERAVWKFLEDNKKEIPWDVAVLAVPFVYGPTFQRVSSPAQLLSTSNFWFQSILSGTIFPTEGAEQNGWIDVRDLAEAHVLCLEREEAGGERIIPCAGEYLQILCSSRSRIEFEEGPYAWREWFDLVRAIAPSVLSRERLPELLKNLPEPMTGEPIAIKRKWSGTSWSGACKRDGCSFLA